MFAFTNSFPRVFQNISFTEKNCTFFLKETMVMPQPSKLIVFSRFQGSKLLDGFLIVWPNKIFLRLLAFFIDCIPLGKYQSSFYEICILAICIKIKSFNRVKRKHLNILNIFLEYLQFYIVASCRWFSPKSCLTNYISRASCL